MEQGLVLVQASFRSAGPSGVTEEEISFRIQPLDLGCRRTDKGSHQAVPGTETMSCRRTT